MPKKTIPEFAAAIRKKYNAYNDVPDTLLAEKIAEKYPQYKDAVDFSYMEKKQENPIEQSARDIITQQQGPYQPNTPAQEVNTPATTNTPPAQERTTAPEMGTVATPEREQQVPPVREQRQEPLVEQQNPFAQATDRIMRDQAGPYQPSPTEKAFKDNEPSIKAAVERLEILAPDFWEKQDEYIAVGEGLAKMDFKGRNQLLYNQFDKEESERLRKSLEVYNTYQDYMTAQKPVLKAEVTSLYEATAPQLREQIDQYREENKDTSMMGGINPAYGVLNPRTASREKQNYDYANQLLGQTERLMKSINSGEFSEGLQGFTSPIAKDFLSMNWNKVARDVRLVEIVNKIEEGGYKPLTPDEEALLNALAIHTTTHAAGLTNIGHDVTKGMAEMIPFMAWFAMTRTPSDAMAKSLQKSLGGLSQQAIQRLAKKQGMNLTAKTLDGIGKFLVYHGQYLPTAAMLPGSYSAAAEHYRGRVEMQEMPDGSIKPATSGITFGRPSLLESAGVGLITGAAEIWGERLFSDFLRIGSKAVGQTLARDASIGQRFVSHLKEQVKWDGIPFEWIEENYTSLWQEGILHNNFEWTGAREQLTLFLTIAGMGGAFSGMNALSSSIGQQDQNIGQAKIKLGREKAGEILRKRFEGNEDLLAKINSISEFSPQEQIDAVEILANQEGLDGFAIGDIVNYLFYTNAQNGMGEAMSTEHVEAMDKAVDDAMQMETPEYTHKDGNVHRADYDGEQVFILDNDGTAATVQKPDGSREVVPEKELEDVEVNSLDDEMAGIQQQKQAESSEALAGEQMAEDALNEMGKNLLPGIVVSLNGEQGEVVQSYDPASGVVVKFGEDRYENITPTEIANLQIIDAKEPEKIETGPALEIGDERFELLPVGKDTWRVTRGTQGDAQKIADQLQADYEMLEFFLEKVPGTDPFKKAEFDVVARVRQQPDNVAPVEQAIENENEMPEQGSIDQPIGVENGSDAIERVPVIGIGDLHGENPAMLANDFEKAGITRDGQWVTNYAVVQIGDVTDRGEYSLELINYLDELQKNPQNTLVRILGNHDLFHIMGQAERIKAQSNPEITERLRQAVLEKRILAAFTEGDVLYTHAGIDLSKLPELKGKSNKEIAQELNDRLFNAVENNDFSDPIFSQDGIFWTRSNIENDQFRQVVGHTVKNKEHTYQDGDRVKYIDTGRIFGGDRTFFENTVVPKEDNINQPEKPDSSGIEQSNKADALKDIERIASIEKPGELLKEMGLPSYVVSFFNSLKKSDVSPFTWSVYGKGFVPKLGWKIREFFFNVWKRNTGLASYENFEISNVEKADELKTILLKNGIYLHIATGQYKGDDTFYAGTQVNIQYVIQRKLQELVDSGVISQQEAHDIYDKLAETQLQKEEAQVNPNPSDAQKEAGNYQKGHVRVQGMEITIENPKGSVRSGTDAQGNPWEITLNNTYGYFKRSKGKDGDQIDVFLGDNLESEKVFIVDQVDNGEFDEHKVMLGFDSAEQASEAYLSNYTPGWNGLGNITETTIESFKEWLGNGTRKRKPAAEYKSFIRPEKQKENNAYKYLPTDSYNSYFGIKELDAFIIHIEEQPDRGSKIYKVAIAFPNSNAELRDVFVMMFLEVPSPKQMAERIKDDLQLKAQILESNPFTEKDRATLKAIKDILQKKQEQPKPEFAGDFLNPKEEPVSQETNDTLLMEFDNGNLVMRDGVMTAVTKDGTPMSYATLQKYKWEYIRQFDFDAGRLAEEIADPRDFTNEEVAQEIIASVSENPGQIIETMQQSNRYLTEDELEYKERAIATHLNKIQNTKSHPSFNRFSDKNNITRTLALAYFNKDGQTVDQVAQAASAELEGEDFAEAVTPDDVVNFMLRYPNGVQSFWKQPKPVYMELEARFEELTGFKPTQKVIDFYNEKKQPQTESINFEDLEKEANQIIATYFAENGEIDLDKVRDSLNPDHSDYSVWTEFPGSFNPQEIEIITKAVDNARRQLLEGTSREENPADVSGVEKRDRGDEQPSDNRGRENGIPDEVPTSETKKITDDTLNSTGDPDANSRKDENRDKGDIPESGRGDQRPAEGDAGNLIEGQSDPSVQGGAGSVGSTPPVVGTRSDARPEFAGDFIGKGSELPGNDGNERGRDVQAGSGKGFEYADTRNVVLSKEEKREIQRKAEDVPVVISDKNNIAETLPYLFPEQHVDVLKAEQRFFTGAGKDNQTGKGILFTNGTGTGKTLSGMGIIKRFVKDGKGEILIVVPNDKKMNDWIEEGQNLFVEINGLQNTKDQGKGVVVTTYANIRDNLSAQNKEWDLVVYDEAHKINANQKGEGTQQYWAHLETSKMPNEARQRATVEILGEAPHHLNRANALMSDDRTKVKDRLPKALEWVEGRLRRLENINTPAAQQSLRIYQGQLEQLKRGMTPAEVEVIGWHDSVKDNKKAIDERARELHARTKVLFLSATPFSYDKNIIFADGSLWDIYNTFDRREGTGRNDAYAVFMIKNFGYQFKYNRLERPETGVDRNLMERMFFENMVRQGVIHGRQLDVPFDYSRDFILFESKTGKLIDRGIKALWEKHKEYDILASYIRKKWGYLRQAQLLESIKATLHLDRIEQHLKAGRKVVIFHNYKTQEPFHPFKLDEADLAMMDPETKDKLTEQYNKFVKEFPEIVGLPLDNLGNPIGIIKKRFPNALFFNGDVKPDSLRRKNTQLFQDDNSGYDLIVIQKDAGKEGISLHDEWGNKQRVLINLGLPNTPTDAIQTEGRIYRLGQKSNAIFEYPVIHTNFERNMYAQTIAARTGTAENLSMGNLARGLENSFVEGYLSAGMKPLNEQGTGQKELDRSLGALSQWDEAKTLYFSRQKRNQQTKSREGKDYFATPEPLGLKMVEWLHLEPNESALEPSAGHGAIARWFPERTTNKYIEPSYELRSDLSINAKGEIAGSDFEDYHISNKFDGIAMNPPFGTGGKTAVDHVQKAYRHLRAGGRLVAIVPQGQGAQRMEKFMYEEDEKGRQVHPDLNLVAVISLPESTFKRAGTGVRTSIYVIDKLPEGAEARPTRNVELSGDINELFDRLENLDLPDRPEKPKEEPQIMPGTGKEYAGDYLNQTGVFEYTLQKNTRTGDPMHSVVMNERTTTQEWKDALKSAKGIDPKAYWSKYSGNGIRPGFVFSNEATAREFVQMMNAPDANEPYIHYKITPKSNLSLFEQDRKPDNREFWTVQRRYSMDKNFSFVGREKIRSTDDVAFIFKSLETASMENVFFVYVQEDGKPIIQHVSMGLPYSAQVYAAAAADGIKRFKAKKLYFIHNHPSGNLEPSRADYNVIKNLQNFYGDIVQPGIIINVDHGTYAEFIAEHANKDLPNSFAPSKPVKHKVYKFDQQIYKRDVEVKKITQSLDVAEFITGMKYSVGDKRAMLVIGRNHVITANLMLDNLDPVEIASKVVRYAGTGVIIYGRDTRFADAEKMREIRAALMGVEIMMLDVMEFKSVPDMRYESMADNVLFEPYTEYGAYQSLSTSKKQYADGLIKSYQGQITRAEADYQLAQKRLSAKKKEFGGQMQTTLFDSGPATLFDTAPDPKAVEAALRPYRDAVEVTQRELQKLKTGEQKFITDVLKGQQGQQELSFKITVAGETREGYHYGLKDSWTDTEIAKAENKAIKRFGLTTDYKEAGWVLADGSLLDFSGKREGLRAGVKNYDHNKIVEALDFDLRNYKPRVLVMNGHMDKVAENGLHAFVDMGNIRLVPGNGLKLKHEPTREQYDTIRGFMDTFNPDEKVYLELNDTQVETRAGEALKAIKDYYNPGYIPGLLDHLIQKGIHTRADLESFVRFNDPWTNFKLGPARIYDNAEMAVTLTKMARGTKEQWKKELLKHGAKEYELEWKNFDETFTDGQVIDRTDIEEWNKENKVEIRVEKNINKKEYIEKNIENYWIYEGMPERLYETKEFALDAAREDAWNDYGDETLYDRKVRKAYSSDLPGLDFDYLDVDLISDAKYQKYQIAQGENYQEWLLQFKDQRKPKFDPAKVGIERKQFSATQGMVRLSYDGKFIAEYDNPGTVQNNYKGKSDQELIDIVARLHEKGDTINKLPSIAGNYSSSHWDIPNVLAHVRMSDFNTRDGKRILTLHEIQSDWAQDGRKQGFDPVEGVKARMAEIDRLNKEGVEKLGLDEWIKTDEYRRLTSEYGKLKDEVIIPRMPFPNTPQWVGLAMRHVIEYAVDNGYDGIAWGTGKQVADVFSLRKQVESIAVSNQGEQYGYKVYAYDKNNNTVLERLATANELPGILGKEFAQKIIDSKIPYQQTRKFTGVELEVGGEGMKGFYDTIIPSWVNKNLKKYGIKAGETKIDKNPEHLPDAGGLDTRTGEVKAKPDSDYLPVHYFPITDKLYDEVAKAGMPMYKTDAQKSTAQYKKVRQVLEALHYNSENTNDMLILESQSEVIEAMTQLNEHPSDIASVKSVLKGNAKLEAFVTTNGTIYYIAENMDGDVKGITKTWLHEQGIHGGLRALIPDDRQRRRLMERVYDSVGEDGFREMMGSSYDSYKDAPKFAKGEEYLGRLAEKMDSAELLTPLEKSTWEKIMNWLNELLSKIYKFTVKLTEQDLKNIVRASVQNVRGYEQVNQAAEPQIAYVSNPDNRGGVRFSVKGQKRTIIYNPIDPGPWGWFVRNFQDRYRPLKRLQDEIIKRGGKVPEWADAYSFENNSRSKSKYEIEHFMTHEWADLMKATSVLSKTTSMESIAHYMIAKHAPERNFYLEIAHDVKDGSGMSDKEADFVVQEFENMFPRDVIDAFWAAKTAATDFTLNKGLQSGLISDEAYEVYKERYQYYVPLRSWEGTKPEDVYDYVNNDLSDKGYNPFKKQAKGRKTISDHPLPFIGSLAHSAIVEGNKNLVKQKYLNLARLNPNMKDLIYLLKTWWVFDGQQWNQTTTKPAQDLWDKGWVKQKRSMDHYLYNTYQLAQQHEMKVLENGETFIVVVADPLVIRPMNFSIDPLTEFMQKTWLARYTRALGKWHTSMNPAFFLPNMARDVKFAITMNLVEKGVKDAAAYVKNIPSSHATVVRFIRGKEDMSKQTDRWYREWIEHGGPTGYVHLWNIREFKRQIDRDIRKLNSPNLDAINLIKHEANLVEKLARWSEDLTRFTAYQTSRRAGKSILQSINDSKESSVNFDRKGYLSGLLGTLYNFFNANIQGIERLVRMWRRAPIAMGAVSASLLAAGFLKAYMFDLLGGDDEEGVPQYDKVSDYLKHRYSVYAIPGSEIYVTVPQAHGMRMWNAFGWIAYDIYSGRKSPEQAIPWIIDATSDSFTPVDIGGLVNSKGYPSVRPLIPHAFSPLYEMAINENFAGFPITNQPYTKGQDYIPNSMRHFRNVNKAAKGFTKELFKLGGGDPNIKNKFYFKDGEHHQVHPWMDVNPALIEHLASNLFGGKGQYYNQVFKMTLNTIEFATDQLSEENNDIKAGLYDNFHAMDIPIANRWIRQPLSDPLKRWYRDSKREDDQWMNTLRLYEGAMERDKVNEMRQSDEYGRIYRNSMIHDNINSLLDLENDLRNREKDEAADRIKSQAREQMMRTIDRNIERP